MESMLTVTNAHSFDVDQFMDPLICDVLLAQPEFLNQLSEQETEEAIAVVDEIAEQRNPETYGGSFYQFYQAANEGMEPYYNWPNVYTPGGKKVEAKEWEPGDQELTEAEKIAYQGKYLAQYPNAKFLAPATWKYNCHSFAWYSTSSANRYWITQIQKSYLLESTKMSTLTTDTRVTYLNNNGIYDHSAIRLSGDASGLVSSKWAQGPAYQHAVHYCPFYN